jgi:DNA-binding NarL/FixJ family response regulator
MPKFKILVVDDHESYRRLVCLILQKRNDLEIVGEASDGLECIRKAQELQPNLILLDIGLPQLNGIRAAKRLCDLVPDAKVVFLTLESSAEVVKAALDSGGSGYVNKAHMVQDLLPAIDTVLKGISFFGSGVRPEPEVASKVSLDQKHEMAICEDESALIKSLHRFTADAVSAGKPAIVIAKRRHLDAIIASLSTDGIDAPEAIRDRILIPLDAEEILTAIMVNGVLDQDRFTNASHDLLRNAAETANSKNSGRIAVCGEISIPLWLQGQTDAGLLLEKLWDDIGKNFPLDSLCGYTSTCFEDPKNDRAAQTLLGMHSTIHRS